MSGTPSIATVLRDLDTSLSSTLEATAKLDKSIKPPEGGLSLLNTKNELLLSYIQNLVFLIVLKIRNAKSPSSSPAGSSQGDGASVASAVEKLVELRLYLEKGVRPLEEKLRFQIEKALRAADDAERSAKAAAHAAANAPSSSDSGSDGDSDSSSGSGSGSDDDDDAKRARERVNARPALSNMNLPRSKTQTGGDKGSAADPSLPYRPPKNRPVVMPSDRREQRGADRHQRDGGYKSRTIDEFISSEFLHNPQELPSIGSTIVNRGRSMKTAAQRAEEDERQAYEEGNLVRLPKLGKKEQAKKNKSEMKRAQMNFGGEEWRDLDQGIRRIETLTQRKGTSGVKGALDRSRKRGRDTVDGPRGSGSAAGVEIGERFNKKLKVIEAGRRDRGKKRK